MNKNDFLKDFEGLNAEELNEKYFEKYLSYLSERVKAVLDAEVNVNNGNNCYYCHKKAKEVKEQKIEELKKAVLTGVKLVTLIMDNDDINAIIKNHIESYKNSGRLK